MDEIELIYGTPEAYAQAIKLLRGYEAVENLSFEKFEAYLMGLDEAETALLDKAIVHRRLQLNSTPPAEEKLLQRIADLERAIEKLNPGDLKHQNQNASSTSSSTQTTIPEILISADDLWLTEAIKRFVCHKSNTVKPGSLIALESKLNLFVKILTEDNNGKPLRISELTGPKIRSYRDQMQSLPKARGGLPQNASVQALLKMKLPPISQKTIKDNSILVSQFLRWLAEESYPVDTKPITILRGCKSPKKRDQEQRLAFSSDDLVLLFESDDYVKGKIKRASEYWIPLIALFTGARMGEIAQLLWTDIRKENEIWVFDLNEDEDGKQLKNENSSRLVPIHSVLLDLGLLDFLKARGKRDKRLFPEEERNESGKFAAYGKRFASLRRRVGIEKPEGKRLDFHSFRHTVRTRLTDASVNEFLIDDIVGHSSNERSIGRKTYTHTQLVPQKKEAIETLRYPIDFDKIKRWDRCKFMLSWPK